MGAAAGDMGWYVCECPLIGLSPTDADGCFRSLTLSRNGKPSAPISSFVVIIHDAFCLSVAGSADDTNPSNFALRPRSATSLGTASTSSVDVAVAAVRGLEYNVGDDMCMPACLRAFLGWV